MMQMAVKKESKPEKAAKQRVKKAVAKPAGAAHEGWDVLSFPYTTEKSVGLIEKENALVFIVDRRANKSQIKDSVEKAFGVRVDSVRTSITQKNFKKAFVKLDKSQSASEVAIRLGII